MCGKVDCLKFNKRLHTLHDIPEPCQILNQLGRSYMRKHPRSISDSQVILPKTPDPSGSILSMATVSHCGLNP
jgi:hypothetical protein